jgi:hypothetical protein
MNRRKGKSLAVILGIIIALIAGIWAISAIFRVANGPDYGWQNPSRHMKGDGTLGE